MKNNNPVVMADVARAGGVSLMTVSLALRNSSRLPEGTRKRIQQVARELGYRQCPLVSALMARMRSLRGHAKHVPSIAYIDGGWPGRKNEHALARFHRGAADCARERGYGFERFRWGPDGMTETRLVQVLGSRGYLGVVFAPQPEADTRLQADWSAFSLAAIGYSIAAPPLNRSVNHQKESLECAVREVRRRGYRRIGLLLTANENQRTSGNWLAAFLLAGSALRPGEYFSHLVSPEEGDCSAEVIRWVRDGRLEVILTARRDGPALLRQDRPDRRRREPAARLVQLHLADDMRSHPGIDQNNEAVGAAAVNLVIEQIQSGQLGAPLLPKTVLVPGNWSGELASVPALAPRQRGRAIEATPRSGQNSRRTRTRPEMPSAPAP